MMMQRASFSGAKVSRPARHAVRRPATTLVVRAAHAAAAPPSLSTYPSQKLSGAKSGQASWLPTAMPRIVQQVSSTGRPLLQLIYTRPHLHFQTLALPATIANEPERWTDINQYVKDMQADGLVLVRPIASPTAGGCACQSTPECSNGSAAAAAVSLSSQSPVDLEGKVGLCCGGGEHHHEHATKSNGNGKKAAAPGPVAPAANSGAISGEEAFYGVVVQSKNEVPTAEDGCYVLRATRNAGLDGCSCTHYSMVHVCSGQPLYEQLKESWLA